MSHPAIRVEHLSKSYRVAHGAPRADTFTDLVSEMVKRAFRPRSESRGSDELFWALRDVNFEVKQGEVVGIIGRNGAGKSTLLKVLSRITAPTEGRVEIRGRVASLLEVGTGFHPELTGRENVYMNGSILGMTRAEIRRKFAEIVAFAEVERFLDTPVKRYSSGMFTRLAFAVAAHLDPEILVIDEVLAVGDAEFQRKCLGAMQDVASQGRTVLFVSHNMPMIERICHRAILLANGSVEVDDSVRTALTEYLRGRETLTGKALAERTDRGGIGGARVVSLTIANADDAAAELKCGDRWKVALSYESDSPRFYRFLIGIYDVRGSALVRLDSHASGTFSDKLPASGTVVCVTEPLNVTPGACVVNVAIVSNTEILDHVSEALAFDVRPADLLGGGITFDRGESAWIVKQGWQVAE